MKTTRWGLIGAGWIATKAIAPAMHAQPNAIVQAVASGDPKRSKLLNPITILSGFKKRFIEEPSLKFSGIYTNDVFFFINFFNNLFNYFFHLIILPIHNIGSP